MNIWIFGITCLSVLACSLPVSSTAIGSAGGVSAFRPQHVQSAGFGETIRNWFRGLKNRIFGANDERVPPVEAKQMMLELENEDPQERNRNPTGLLVDLSTITFDPETDWGFHLGNWYFIKKRYNATSPKNRQTTQEPYSEWSMTGKSVDEDSDPVTMRPENPMTTEENSSTSEQSLETTDIADKSLEYTETSTEAKGIEDNEIIRKKEENLSTEVLSPL